MDPRLKEATQLEKEIRELEGRLQEEYLEIGRRLGALPAEFQSLPKVAAQLRLIRVEQEKHEALKREAETLLKTAADLDVAEQKIGELKSRLEKIAPELEAKASELGTAAARVYPTLPSPETFRPFFEPVLEADAEIERLEKELTAMEEEDKSRGFFGKLVSKGKSIGVKGSISKQREARAGLMGTLGKRLLDSTFAAHLTSEPLALFEAATRLRLELAASQKQLGDLALEQEGRRARLQEICGARDPAEVGRELEQKVASAGAELDRAHARAARELVDDGTMRGADDPGMVGRLNYAHSLRTAVESKSRRVAFLRGHLEIEELFAREKTLRKKKEQIQAEIRLREEQIRAIDDEIGRGARRVEELKRTLEG
jgi:hypothetical protein